MIRRVYGCGLSASGALAIPSLVKPRQIDGETPVTAKQVKYPKRIDLDDVRHISAGFGFSLFASENVLYGSGLNNRFQIACKQSEEYMIRAKRIRLAEDPKILQISSGRAHSLILTTNGVFAFGENCFGQCGFDPQKSETLRKPTRLNIEENIKYIHCSLDSSFLVTQNGEVLSFGLNEDGQCANSEYGIQHVPTKIVGEANDAKIAKVAGSTDTILALSENGEVLIWGQTEYGQGLESSQGDIQLNVSRNICRNIEVSSIASTSSSCIISTSSGEVYVWGIGVLGMGPKTEKLSGLTKMDQPLFDDLKVKQIYAGNTNMAALNEKGNLFVWGENRFSTLGLGHKDRQHFPFRISIPGSIENLSLGPDISLFLAS
ncbi:unnamed protein product [Caenorhabditis angaria]|uniref:Uncharacterized protein n=1 Tax=Caenorhabditis angaria TaxID=860376 RepID=A0A9P1MRU2_9PELO|nr:unnamed protein product [Caenorhabditis angaria]